MARGIVKAVVAGAAGVLAAVVVAAPAQAASSRCVVGSSGTCTTAVVRGHATYNFVDYVINNNFRPSPCPWRVRDVHTQVVVGSGTVGTNSRTSGSIFGLYGYYQLELRGCSISAVGIIDNNY